MKHNERGEQLLLERIMSDFSLFYMYMISCVLLTMILNEYVMLWWLSKSNDR